MTLLMVFLFAGLTSAATFKVDDDGDPSIYFKNLDTALWTAATYGPGPHTIEIYEGTYNDAGLTVPTNVGEIIGIDEERSGIFFVAPTYQAVDFLDISGTDGLTLMNFTVQDYKTAVLGTGVDNVIITDIEFDNNGVDGYVVPADEDGGAIILYDCDDGWFENLHIHDGERGIRLRGSQSNNNTIRNNLVEHNEQYGIGIGWAGTFTGNVIDSNTVIGSEDFGIQIRGAGNNNTIRGNVVDSCIWEGILNNGATGGTIDATTCYAVGLKLFTLISNEMKCNRRFF